MFPLYHAIRDILLIADPDIIAIELDSEGMKEHVYIASGHKKPGISYKCFYRKVARMFDAKFPGEEFLSAIIYANQYNKQLAMVDMTRQMLIDGIKKLKWYHIAMIPVGVIALQFLPEKTIRNMVIKLIIKGNNGPSPLDGFLIEERNDYMAQKLIELDDNNKIVMVTGDAHVEGLAERLKKANIEVETIRLIEIIREYPVIDDYWPEIQLWRMRDAMGTFKSDPAP